MKSQTSQSGFSSLPVRKRSVLFFVCMSLGLFALIQFSGIFDGAYAASSIDVRNMSGSDVRKAFADPELVWAEFPGVVWQYRTDSCVMDIYFSSMQEDVSSAPVAHYELRPRSNKGGEADMQACLRRFLRAKGGFFL